MVHKVWKNEKEIAPWSHHPNNSKMTIFTLFTSAFLCRNTFSSCCHPSTRGFKSCVFDFDIDHHKHPSSYLRVFRITSPMVVHDTVQWIHHHLINHSPLVPTLSLLQFFAMTNSTHLSAESFSLSFRSLSWNQLLRSEMIVSKDMDILLTFYVLLNCLPQRWYQFSQHWRGWPILGFPFFCILPNICYFDDSHSDKCEVISHCCFLDISLKWNHTLRVHVHLVFFT